MNRPKTIGRYAVSEVLASRGDRAMSLGRDLARQRAVSILTVTIADPARKKYALSCARAAAALEHPNVAAVYEVGQEQDDLFVVTEPLLVNVAPSDAVLLDVARALAAAHKRGTTHGAFDRFSVWKTRDGEVKVVGFGTRGVAHEPHADVLAFCDFAARPDWTALVSMDAILSTLEPASETTTREPFQPVFPRWGTAVVMLALASAALLYAFLSSRRSGASAMRAVDDAPASVAVTQGGSVDPRANALFAAALQSRRDAAMPVARATLDEALQIDPAFAAAHLYRAIWWYGIDEEARAHLARASDLRANLTPGERTLLGAFEPLMRAAQDAPLAIDRLTQASNDHPEDADLRFYTGVAYFLAGDFQHAIVSMSAAHDRDPSLAEALRLEAYFRAYIGDDRAAEIYAQCIDVSPAATHCLRGLSALHRYAGRGDEALAIARRMIALDPSSSIGRFELAEALECVGAPDDAVSEALEHDAARVAERLRQSRKLELRAKHAILHGRFDDALRDLNDWEEAIASEGEEEIHFNPVQKKIDLLLEMDRPAEARRVIDDFMKRRTAWTPQAMIDNVSIIAWGQAYRASALSHEAFADHRASWLARLAMKPSPWLDGDGKWVLAYAMAIRTKADANDAISVLEAAGHGRVFSPSLLKDPNTYDGYLGVTLERAGHPGDALAPLHRATSSCGAIDEPFEHLWAREAEAEALDAIGRRSDACAAYKDVLAHWGTRETHSSTAERARRRLGQCHFD